MVLEQWGQFIKITISLHAFSGSSKQLLKAIEYNLRRVTDQ